MGAKSENFEERVEAAKRYCKGMTRKLSTREANWCRITICERLRWDRGDNDRICFEPAGRGKPDYNGGTGARAKTQPPGEGTDKSLSMSGGDFFLVRDGDQHWLYPCMAMNTWPTTEQIGKNTYNKEDSLPRRCRGNKETAGFCPRKQGHSGVLPQGASGTTTVQQAVRKWSILASSGKSNSCTDSGRGFSIFGVQRDVKYISGFVLHENETGRHWPIDFVRTLLATVITN